MPQTIQLSWVPRAGAVRYRVEILAGGRVAERHVVEEPSLTLEPAQPLPAGAQWRVAWASGDDDWELHVPAVDIPGAARESAVTIDWAPTGAPAYRVVVRDDRRGEIVVRQTVVGPPAHVDWSELTTHHAYRRRVQEWREGTWVDIDVYRPLRVPDGLALHPPDRGAPAPSAVAVRHAVVVRCSGAPPAADHGEWRPRAWLEARLRLLAEWTLPAVAAMLGPEDVCVLVGDESLGADDLQRAAAAQPAAVAASDFDALREALAPVSQAAELLAVTELTAGDRPHPTLLERVHDHAGELAPAVRALVTFPLTARLDQERGTATLERYPGGLTRTTVVPGGEGAIAEALDRDRPVLDEAYAPIEDPSLVAVVRAWPGPNALSAMHGELLGPLDAGELRDAFALTGDAVASNQETARA